MKLFDIIIKPEHIIILNFALQRKFSINISFIYLSQLNIFNCKHCLVFKKLQ
jgi:hypothetical protein